MDFYGSLYDTSVEYTTADLQRFLDLVPFPTLMAGDRGANDSSDYNERGGGGGVPRPGRVPS